MLFVKYVMLAFVFGVSVKIGLVIANRYRGRVNELKEMKDSINIFKTKIMFTYEPLPEIFEELSESAKGNIGNIFKMTYREMSKLSAGEAWKKALDNTETFMSSEDISCIRTLSNLLGKTDLTGQLNEIELVDTYLTSQIGKAEQEREKNEKLFKTLGTVVGIALVIILI